MSLRTSLLGVVNLIRSIADETLLNGGVGLDVRLYTVVRRRIRHHTGKSKLGEPTVEDLEIVPKPRVREAGQGSILIVDQITPKHTTGGYSSVELNPPDEPGFEFMYVVTGPDGLSRNYKLTEIETVRPFNITLTLQTLDRKPPY